MSLPALRAIRNLVVEGAVIVGSKPIDDPSLADDQAEFRSSTKNYLAMAPEFTKW